MKKNISIVMVIMLLLLSLVGCSNGSDNLETDSANGTETENTSDNEVYTLKFAHVVRPTTPKGMAAERFKELIEERSEGRIKVDVYADSQLGNDQEINEQILTGTIDMNAPYLGTVVSFVKELELLDLPYLFTDRENAFNALHGDLGEKFNEYLAEKGFKALGYWTGGFKQFTNSVRPIENVEDLNGLKIRVSQSPILVSQFRALNAGGISVPFSELYSALQTKTVDGQENPLANIASKKFYEVQDYMTLSNHGFMGYAFIIGKEKYDNLPSDLQQLVDEVALEVNQWEWTKTFEKEEEYLEEVKNAGVTISEFDEEDIEEYLEVTKNVYEEFRATENGKELLEIVEESKN